jgi:outer membrane receptor protein involved in Fe transport
MYSGTQRYIHSYLEELQTPVDERTRTQSTTDQLLKVQWNLKESHVLTLQALHNSAYFGNSGLSLVRPRETTTNALRRGFTIGVSDRHAASGKLFETTFQWTRDRDSELAKGVRDLEVRPNTWSGNFYTDRREKANRVRGAHATSIDARTGGIAHRVKAGGEFDWVSSAIQLDQRAFRTFDEDDNLVSLITFSGSNFTDIRNQEYGAFVQDRLILSPKLQIEFGLRYDRERVAGRNNFAPRGSFLFLPFGTARSKISGGLGLFYDNLTLLSLQLPHLQRRYTTVYEDDVAVAAAAATSVRVDPALRNPRGVHWNLAWAHAWAPRWVTRIDVIRKYGDDQVRLAAEPTAAGFDMIFNNSGRSHYRAVEISLDRPIRDNVRFLASYIYSKATARPSLSLDFPDPAIESMPESPVSWNTPHRFVGWGYFPLPSGLSASFSVEARSGFPFNAFDQLNRIVGDYNGRDMPAYFVTNASVEKQLPIPLGRGKRMAFRVGVTNLFNRFNPRFVNSNVHSPYFLYLSDSSGRHFSARVRILKR